MMSLAPCWLVRHHPGTIVRLLRYALIVIAFVALGALWAAWRAESRLAQELPREWESRDIDLIGAVASLPQLNERGTRVEFDVETVLTAGAFVPKHVSLAWYAEIDRKSKETTVPPVFVPGERWRGADCVTGRRKALGEMVHSGLLVMDRTPSCAVAGSMHALGELQFCTG